MNERSGITAKMRQRYGVNGLSQAQLTFEIEEARKWTRMPGERVIDVGCGSGAAFAPRKPKAVAPKLEERRRTVQARDRSATPRSLVLQLCGVGVVAG
jgi:2-polyprenyl-3-methyl-5-hydroxy-6-metoxy-1,4-benzoquinol methylase